MYPIIPMQTPCIATEGGTTLTCLAPPVDSGEMILIYTLMLDGFMFADSTDPDLMIAVRPDPNNFVLVNSVIESASTPLQIQVRPAQRLISK